MLRFDDRGLVPAIVQDATTGDVLTLAFMNEEALRRTIEGPDAWFFSRSRNVLWHKGETSGNYLRVEKVIADCDSDAVVVKVRPTGPACHTGQQSCFHNPLSDVTEVESVDRALGPGVLVDLVGIIEQRKKDAPAGSYTAKLFAEGTPRIAQKVIEEAGETALAAVSDPDKLAEETADMIYHAMVLLSAAGVKPEAVWKVLNARRK